LFALVHCFAAPYRQAIDFTQWGAFDQQSRQNKQRVLNQKARADFQIFSSSRVEPAFCLQSLATRGDSRAS
jgi:hypothetical protein